MKKIKSQPRKLVLTSVTIRKLTADQLLVVAAGRRMVNDSTVYTAPCN